MLWDLRNQIREEKLRYNEGRFPSLNFPMTLITLQNIKKDFGIKEILRDGSFSIEEQDKVGLIGVNGSGKSTLLKAIAGIETFDSGIVTVKSGARIVYLPQQPNLNEDKTVLDEVFNDSSEKLKLVREYESLSQKIASESISTLANEARETTTHSSYGRDG
jgi:ABC transport system ATP-binding/permease protein